MASPQRENGHTDIAHEVLEALMQARLTGTQWDLVMVVIRKTWGWHKKEDHISLKQFQKLTGRHRNLIARELAALQKRNIIQQIQKPTPNRAAKWKFNKDWDTWGSPPRVTGVTAEGDTFQGAKGVTAEGDRGVTAEVNLQKKEEKKEEKKENRTTKSDKKRCVRKKGDYDPRFQPLKKFFHQKYREIRGSELDADVSDYKALSDLLRRQPTMTLEDLKSSVVRCLKDDDPFNVKQGRPLRWWAQNINPFLPGRKQQAGDLEEAT